MHIFGYDGASVSDSQHFSEEENSEESQPILENMTIEQEIEEIRASHKLVPFDSKVLTEELKQRAKIELHETEEKKKEYLKELKNLLKEEKDLVPCLDDNFLLAFLRARKFDLKKAFTLVKHFYSTRKKYWEVYDDFDFSTVKHTMDLNVVGFLPFRDADGSLILIIQAGSWNPMDVNMTEIMRTLTSGLVQAITSEATQIAGFKVIVDFKGFGMKQLTSIGTSYLWLFAEALQNCFPGRFRGVHIINEGPLFTYIWAVLKAVLTKKLKERFFFHGRNMKRLHKHITPAVLPEEYGGDLGPWTNSVWAKKMEEYEDHIYDTYMKYGYKKK